MKEEKGEVGVYKATMYPRSKENGGMGAGAGAGGGKACIAGRGLSTLNFPKHPKARTRKRHRYYPRNISFFFGMYKTAVWPGEKRKQRPGAKESRERAKIGLCWSEIETPA